MAGGVSANSSLRRQLERLRQEQDLRFYDLPLSLCTDNAAMVAFRGQHLYRQGRRGQLDLNVEAYAPLPGAA